MTVLSAPCSPSNLSSVTLVGSSPSDTNEGEATSSPQHSPKKAASPKKEPSPTKEPTTTRPEIHHRPSIKHEVVDKKVERCVSEDTEGESEQIPDKQITITVRQIEDMTLFFNTMHRASCSSSRSASISTSTTSAVLQVSN